MLQTVRIAVDHAFDAFVFCVPPEPPVHVEAEWTRIEFDPGAGRGARVDHGLLVDFVRLAFEQQAPSQMAEHVDEWIFRGANKAFRRFGFVLREALVNARDDNLELGEQIVLKIQLAFAQDIHFRAGEKAAAPAGIGGLLVDLFDFLKLLAQE